VLESSTIWSERTRSDQAVNEYLRGTLNCEGLRHLHISDDGSCGQSTALPISAPVIEWKIAARANSYSTVRLTGFACALCAKVRATS